MERKSAPGADARVVPAIVLLSIFLLAVVILAGVWSAPAIHAQTVAPAQSGLSVAETSEAGAWQIGALADECSAGDGVCLYEHPGYGGRWVRFVGSGCYGNFNDIGFNDIASSLRFTGSYAGRYTAVLYEHTYYAGVASQFAYDDPDFGNDAIGNDRASSICINPAPVASACIGDGVYLYEHTNYGGACQRFTTNVDNLTTTGFNDIASSIRLAGSFSGGSTRVTLCEHAGYGGACSQFTADDPDLRDDAVGNDRTTSVAIAANAAACPTITNWRGEYWNNTTLAGAPVLCRDDAAVNFDWGLGGPGGGVNNDYFSARWTREMTFNAGTYRFFLSGDDGVRLWINGQLVIDQWRIQSRTQYTQDLSLAAGNYALKVEYFENTGEANVALSWSQLSGSACPAITDWKGEYWNNRDLAGAPVLCRNDVNVNFNWGAGGPGGSVPDNNFSARWTRSLYFPQGRYRFHVASDDGVRLWLDGVLVIDQWRDQARTEYTVDRDLTAGNHSLRLDYYENLGDANVSLWWDQSVVTCPAYRAEYFNNQQLAGAPAYVTCEAAPLSHNWGIYGPGNGIGNDNFSARWTGRFHFDAGTTTFVARTDDGMRVWLNGGLLIDAWRVQAATEYRQSRTLAAGDYDVRIEYYENTGEAVAQFSWTQASTASGVVTSNKPAFDTCRLPLAPEMQEWWNSSPYYEANIYLGGISRACNDWNQQTLTAGWVQAVHNQGWNFIPTWVGPQAPCNTSGLARMSSDANTAFAQGRSEADAAVNAARAVGLTALGTGRTVIYYSLAPFPGDAGCRNTVSSFMSGWAGRLRELGMRSGGYGASCASYVADWASIANVPDNAWPATANWPRYDPSVTVWNAGSCVPNTLWTNHQRIFQYTPPHTEWWGSVGLNIDSNIADGDVAGTHSRVAGAAAAAGALTCDARHSGRQPRHG